MTSPDAAGFRPEVQALRALAVAMVVINHLWPAYLPGGFAGVDVFFVISGYLITAHLLRELEATGSVDLASFWSRRVRRLLPAALLVLVVCFVLTLAVLPSSAWRENLTQILASTLYVENWVLVGAATDYFAAENAATMVQHYWSLSVEEQFYLVWPIALVVVAGAGARRVREGGALRRGVIALIVIAGVLSLGCSILLATGAGNAGAYFSTVTRVWEFMAGAALVFLAPRGAQSASPGRRAVTYAAGWAGFVVVVASAFLLRGGPAFPGAIALIPVAGAALVIIAGTSASRWSSGWLVRPRPVQYLGGISYSLYLWHWPLIVAAPFALVSVGGLSTWWQRMLILALSVALAALTKRFVEDRFRAAPAGLPRRRANRRALLVPVTAGVTMIVAVTAVNVLVVSPRAQAVERAIEQLRVDGCLGADAIRNNCADAFGAASTLDPMLATTDRVPVCDPSLGRVAAGDTAATCVYGDVARDPVIAVIGDSHAQIIAFYTARWAVGHGYAVAEYTSSACPAIVTRQLDFPHDNRATTAETPASWEACRSYAERALAEIAAAPNVVGVVVTNATRAYLDEQTPGRSILTPAAADAALRRVAGDGRPVLVVRDVPGLGFDQGTAPQCLAQHPDDPEACSAPRATVLPADDPMLTAARRFGAHILDLSDAFCDAGRCYAAVGGVIAYWDRAHVTRTMGDTLEPAIDDALAETFDGGGDE